MLQEFYDVVTLIVNWVWQLLNSNFFTALAGALAGALGATWIVYRIDRNRRLREEIRSTNAAIMVAFGITISYCAVKDQLVKHLKDDFDTQRTRLEAFQVAKKKGSIPPELPFEYEANFQTIMPVPVTVEVLRKLLFEKISVVGRPLTLIATLSQCIDGLNTSLEQRNEIIEKFKANHPESPAVSASIYFGIPSEDGHVDTRYPDSVRAISAQTDDCIFFSKLLGEDLFEHGEELAKTFGRKSPKIQKIDFQKTEQNGLIPDSKLYLDWINMNKGSADSK